MKEIKAKKITIDKLAIMVANGFERIDKKMVTKDDLKNLEINLSSRIEGINNRIDDMSLNRVKYEDHNKLKVRVDFLEKHLK